MPHAKAVSIDGTFATLGSANMDQRSFRLNFEGNVFFYGAKIAQQLEQDFEQLCDSAIEVTLDSRRQLTLRQKLLESTARILSPML
jgi:cardiolipin synthase